MCFRTLILRFAILVCAAIHAVAQPTPPRVVTAPVTVVAPQTLEAEPLTTGDKNEPAKVVHDGPIKVVQSGPVTFTLPLGVWIAWLVSIATGLGAVAVIWKFITKASAIVNDFSNYGSVLKEIAKEFKNDSGSTLKDSIDRIELAAKEAHASADTAKQMADNLEKTLRDHIVATKTREEMRDNFAPRREREQQQA